MSTIATPSHPLTASPIKQFIQQHPLLSYFLIVFGGTWLMILPVLLSQDGLGLLPYRLPGIVAFIFFMIGAFTGPTFGALVVTGIADGKAGIKLFFRRYIQWRVGIKWYLLIFLGYPALYIAGASVSLGIGALTLFLHHWPLLFTLYLPQLLLINMIDALGEEPGFRGFALTRAQRQYGPLVGTLLVAALHALWHLPAYFIPLAIGGGWSSFAMNSVGIIALSVIWAWVFNNAKGSILIALLLHSASNANYVFINTLYPNYASFRLGIIVLYVFFIVVSLLLILVTKGRLSYKNNKAE